MNAGSARLRDLIATRKGFTDVHLVIVVNTKTAISTELWLIYHELPLYNALAPKDWMLYLVASALKVTYDLRTITTTDDWPSSAALHFRAQASQSTSEDRQTWI
jgi:hypothetical protein